MPVHGIRNIQKIHQGAVPGKRAETYGGPRFFPLPYANGRYFGYSPKGHALRAQATPGPPHTFRMTLLWHVYLLQCRDGTLYCGITTDPDRRLLQHNGLLPGGARYTRGRRPVRLLACRVCPNRSKALRLEKTIKSLPREKKAAFLLQGDAGPASS